MTIYDPSVHRTVVAANGESSRKFHSINKLLIDMDAAGMIKIAAQDLAPSDTTVVWLDLTIPEDGNGQAKVYDSGSWVPLTPEYFALHYGASTAAAAASALAAANSASAAEGFKNQTISDASATAADVLTADAAKVAALAAQSAAEQARDEAEIAADNFDDVYLGSKATDPTLDNDGDALVEGQLYWSSATNALKVYDGASWVSYSAASGITDLVDDTSPQLGGNLDLNGHVITGLEIGTNVQAQSSNLDSWSMVVPSDYLTTTAAAAAYQPISATLTSLAGASANGVSLVTAADYAAMRGLLDLEAGTDFLSPSAISAAYQPLSARLSDVAGLAVTDSNIIVGNGTTWVAESGATARTSLGLGTGDSPQFTGVNLAEAAAPSTPASGILALYAKTDGKLYSKDDAGTEREVGASAGRELLTANRTYYVRTDGSDSNDGLSDTSGGAFLTIQAAVNAAASLDLGVYNVTISVGAGTYTGAVELKTIVGAGTVSIIGDTGTPSNVLISCTSVSSCFRGDGSVGKYSLQGMKLTCTTTGRGIYGSGGGLAITFGNIEFGAMPSGYYHIDAQDGCRIQATANYTISAGITSGMHIYCNGGHVLITGRTITLTGTPAFSVFLRCIFTGVVEAQTASFSGSATGSRYDAFGCGVIYTNGGGSSFFPGSSAGSTATGGQYL